MTSEELKLMHELESKNYIEDNIGKDEAEFRKKFLDEQLSLQFLVDDGNISENDEEYGDRMIKLLSNDHDSKVKELKQNMTNQLLTKTMSNGGRNDFVQAVLQCFVSIDKLGEYFITNAFLDTDRD